MTHPVLGLRVTLPLHMLQVDTITPSHSNHLAKLKENIIPVGLNDTNLQIHWQQILTLTNSPLSCLLMLPYLWDLWIMAIVNLPPRITYPPQK